MRRADLGVLALGWRGYGATVCLAWGARPGLDCRPWSGPGLHAAHVPCHAGWEAIHSRAVAQRVLANRLKLEAELLQGIEDVTPADYQGDVKV